MKENTPAGNIVIGIVYFLIISAIIYVTKLSLQSRDPQKEKAKQPKYNPHKKAEDVRKKNAYRQIPTLSTVVKAYLLKYNIVGTLLNPQKIYLLKELAFLSIYCVGCLSINTLTLWPVALVLPLLLASVVALEYAKAGRI